MNPFLLRYALVALAVAVGFGGGYFFKPAVGKKVVPHIESVNAVYGVGNKIRVTGSGFANYNSFRVKDSHFLEPLFATADGKELIFRLSMAVRRSENQAPWVNCGAGKTCSVPLQIINGDGMTSNVFNFLLTMPDRPNTATYGPASDTPPAQNVKPGTNVDVLHTTIRASSDNYDEIQLNEAGVVLTSDKPLDCSKTFGLVTLSDIEGNSYYTYPLWQYITPYSWSPIPSGSCITTFTFPGVFSAQDSPEEVVISPGAEKTFIVHVVVKEGVPAITFKTRLGFPVGLYDGESESKFGNPVTIQP